MKIEGKIFDFVFEKFKNVVIEFNGGKILNIKEIDKDVNLYILPGLIDSHVHIESSMLIPSSFATFALKCGVISVIADPHEIANVLGIEGVKFMINDSKKSKLKFNFAAPSCVPATSFETTGAKIEVEEISELLKLKEVVSLAEMMNFPGVLNDETDVLKKINSAHILNKPIDGHCPMLSGKFLKKYINAGISTDHESSTYEEAFEKIKNGMFVQIRQGSAAKNLNELWQLVDEFPDKVMLCTDDIHPDDFKNGYINEIVKFLLFKNISLKKIYKAAFFNPIKHYKIDNIGQLRIGDSADFIVLKNLDDFSITKTFINGECVYDEAVNFIFSSNSSPLNNFNAKHITSDSIKFNSEECDLNVILAKEGELLTEKFYYHFKGGSLESDIFNDILKIVVLNRYDFSALPSIAFIKGFGLLKGAIATSVAHDSHNIICVGTNDSDISFAINKVIDLKGGLCVVDGIDQDYLQLEYAGLMSGKNPNLVAEKYHQLNLKSKSFGCALNSPFMTMSFMALLVIPHIKISDKGLFDVDKFSFINIIKK